MSAIYLAQATVPAMQAAKLGASSIIAMDGGEPGPGVTPGV
jgi:hypothetical protein